MKKKNLIISVASVLILATGVSVYFNLEHMKKAKQANPTEAQQRAASLVNRGSSIFL